jgi:hypothetical protein
VSALRLYGKHTMAELVELQKAVTSDPANQIKDSIYLYCPKARKKLADIAQAITWHLADKRAADGRPVPTNGYSGRQSNRR